jgi:hypothetical protein
MLKYKLLSGIYFQARKKYKAGDVFHSPIALCEKFPDRFVCLGDDSKEVAKKVYEFIQDTNKHFEKAPEAKETPVAESVTTEDKPKFTIENNGRWFNIVNAETGKRLNDKALDKEAAEKLLKEANA